MKNRDMIEYIVINKLKIKRKLISNVHDYSLIYKINK